MKKLIPATVAMLILGVTSACLAQQSGADESASTEKAAADKKVSASLSDETPATEAKAKPPVRPLSRAAAARVRAKVHRTMAALAEAEAAEKPNEAKIKQLNKQLETMCARLQCPTPLSPKAVAELRAKTHRTMAALAEAEAAEKPDEAKIGQLNEELETMRAKLQWSYGSDSTGQCPMGGPGRGQGQGYGRGQGMGMGQGQGQGMWQGQGMGQGRGQGMGQGRGQGMGQGQGMGRGQGRGGGGRR